jgi:tetratricopeptide (TPR) repeat protein
MAAQDNTSVIWDVPHERNPHFVGREGLLAEAWQRMVGGDRVQVLYGLGGVGKTQAAIEYAYRRRDDYTLIWWVPAQSESAVLTAYAKLAHRLGDRLSPKAAPALVVELITGMLAGHRPLLIFDGAPDAAFLRPLLPGNAGGHVLVTSRSPNWGGVAHTRPVRVLDREESVAFLRERTGLADPDRDGERLAQSLGDLPLALEQAAAVIQQGKLSFSGYLRRFESQWAVMLGEGLRAVDYPQSIAMTWSLAFHAVEEAAPAAADLLNLVAFLNSDDVPFSLLRDGAYHLPASLQDLVAEPPRWGAALAALLDYSLVEVDGRRGFGTHRLVATVTRDRMDATRQQLWCTVAVTLLAAVFKFNSADVTSWEACGALLPHVLEATAHAERLDVAIDKATQLLNDAGRYLLKRAQFQDARQVLERAMALCVRAVGPTDPKVSAIANNLGRVHEHLGNDDLAMKFFEQVIAVDTAVYGMAHPHVADVVNNYGICMQKRGDREMARQHFEWAAQIYEANHGPDHPKLAQILNNLGYALKSLNDQEGARFQLLRALAIAERTVGRDHPTTARILFNLADQLRATDQLAAARENLERALTIDQSALGPNHPDVRADCEALAAVLVDLNEPARAAELRERAARIGTGGGRAGRRPAAMPLVESLAV